MTSDLENIRKQALTTHNIYRKNHKSPKMEIDTKLCKEAQKYAEYLASIHKVVHDENTNCGENIITLKGVLSNGRNVTNWWYKEINKYNFDNPRFDPSSGHFTQVVWKNSKFFGYGEAVSNHKTIYAVARYFPAGNVDKEFAENVVPPLIKPLIKDCNLDQVNIL